MIDPLKFGLSIVESAQRGGQLGRTRALEEIRALDIGYKRASQEIDDKIKLEELKFKYEILLPLEIAKKKAEIEYIRNRSFAQKSNELMEISHLNETEQEWQSALNRSFQLRKLVNDLPKELSAAQLALEEGKRLENDASLPEDKRQEVAQSNQELERKISELRAIGAAIGSALHQEQKRLSQIMQSMTSSSRYVQPYKMRTAMEMASLNQIISQLPEVFPEALQSYNLSVSRRYLDLLPQPEQRNQYLSRIANLSTALSEEDAKMIYEQTLSANRTLSLGERISSIKKLQEILTKLRVQVASNPYDTASRSLLELVESSIRELQSDKQLQADDNSDFLEDIPEEDFLSEQEIKNRIFREKPKRRTSGLTRKPYQKTNVEATIDRNQLIEDYRNKKITTDELLDSLPKSSNMPYPFLRNIDSFLAQMGIGINVLKELPFTKAEIRTTRHCSCFL